MHENIVLRQNRYFFTSSSKFVNTNSHVRNDEINQEKIMFEMILNLSSLHEFIKFLCVS